MKIETRFDLRDEVFFMHKNKVGSATVKGVAITILPPKDDKEDERIDIMLRFIDEHEAKRRVREFEDNSFMSFLENMRSDTPFFMPEDKCFASKEELLKSL